MLVLKNQYLFLHKSMRRLSAIFSFVWKVDLILLIYVFALFLL
jgi:hypothetical protein